MLFLEMAEVLNLNTASSIVTDKYPYHDEHWTMLLWGCKLYTFSTIARTKWLICMYCIKLKNCGVVFMVDINWLLGFIKISLYYNTAEEQHKPRNLANLPEFLSAAGLYSCHMDGVQGNSWLGQRQSHSCHKPSSQFWQARQDYYFVPVPKQIIKL